MEFLGRQEIYIPADAEVQNIPLRSLPNSVLRRMGLSLPDSDGSRRLPGSPEAIMICPAVLRPRGERSSPNRGNGAVENMFSSLSREFRSTPGPVQMSFVTSNRNARRVLRGTLQGANVSADTSSTSLITPASAPHTYQIALVIYERSVYLSIRRPRPSQRQGEATEQQPAALAPAPSSSNGHASPGMKSRLAPRVPLRTTKGKPQRKRLRIPLPAREANALLKDIRATANLQRGREALQTAASIPQSTIRAHRPNNHPHPDARVEPTSENGAVQRQEDARSSVSDTPVQINHNNNSDNVQTVSMQGLSRTEPRRAPPSLQQEFDFSELEEEERIAQMMARLEQQEEAVGRINPL